MKADHVVCNTCAHDKYPKPKKKSTRRPQENDDDAIAVSVSSRGSDHTKSKTVAPPLPFPPNYQPLSVPPHVNDSLVKVADLLAQPTTAAKMDTNMMMMTAEANAAHISSVTKIFDMTLMIARYLFIALTSLLTRYLYELYLSPPIPDSHQQG